MNKKNRVCSMASDSDVLAGVIPNLWIDKVMEIRGVSKSWKSSVDESGYVEKDNPNGSGFIGIGFEDSKFFILYVRYDNINGTINRKFLSKEFAVEPLIVGSRRGIVCIALPNSGGMPDSLFYWNPVNHEELPLPDVPDVENGSSNGDTKFCFGHHDGKHILVRICWEHKDPDNKDDSIGNAHIFDLVKYEWKHLDEARYYFRKEGAYSDGRMYWIDFKKRQVICLYLDVKGLRKGEFFSPVTNPPFNIHEDHTQLFELNEKVCLLRELEQKIVTDTGEVIGVDEVGDEELAVWTLDDGEWIKLFKFSLGGNLVYPVVEQNDHEIFSLVNNEVLCWVETQRLYCYNTTTGLHHMIFEDLEYEHWGYVPYTPGLTQLKHFLRSDEVKDSDNEPKKREESSSSVFPGGMPGGFRGGSAMPGMGGGSAAGGMPGMGAAGMPDMSQILNDPELMAFKDPEFIPPQADVLFDASSK